MSRSDEPCRNPECCPAFVTVTEEEIARIEQFTGRDRSEFSETIYSTVPMIRLTEQVYTDEQFEYHVCPLFDKETGLCTAYETNDGTPIRPQKCQDYPCPHST